MPDYPEMTMVTPDRPRRTRRVWALTAALVALAVATPVVVLLADEAAPRGVAGDSTQLTGGATSPTPTSTPAPTDVAPTPTETASASAVPVLKGKPRALFFGDSYFIGGGYTDESNSMAKLAANRLGWVAEINGGGGTGFVQANPEYNLPNFLGQIDNGAFDVGKRRWVVIEGGNDDRFVDQKQVSKNARKVLRIAQRRFPNATVVLVGPLDTDGDFSDTTPVNKTLRKAAQRRDVPYLDIRGWLKGHYDLIGPDFTHPYPEGHRILGKKLAKRLRALGA